MNVRGTAEKGAATNVQWPAGGVAHDTAGFADQQRSGGHVPRRDALFPVGIESAGGHPRTVDGARAESPDTGDLGHEQPHLTQEVVVFRLAGEWNADREHRILYAVTNGDPDGLAIEERTVPLAG